MAIDGGTLLLCDRNVDFDVPISLSLLLRLYEHHVQVPSTGGRRDRQASACAKFSTVDRVWN